MRFTPEVRNSNILPGCFIMIKYSESMLVFKGQYDVDIAPNTTNDRIEVVSFLNNSECNEFVNCSWGGRKF